MSNNNDTELPQASPEAIEDKLKAIIETIAERAVIVNHDGDSKDFDSIHADKDIYKAKQQIQAIITTETTNARIAELEALLPFTEHQPHKSLKSAAHARNHLRDSLKEVLQDRLAALQKEQNND